MKRIAICLAVSLVLFIDSNAQAQSEQQGFVLLKEGINLKNHAQSTQDNETSLTKFNQALKIFDKVGSIKGRTITLGWIGKIYSDTARYPQALNFYEQSLMGLRKLGDISGEADMLDNIGGILYHKGQYQKALDSFERALRIKSKTGDSHKEAITLNNIGMVLGATGEYRKALGYYERSLEKNRKKGDAFLESSVLDNMGDIFRLLGQYSRALEYQTKCLEIRRKIKDVAGEGRTLNNIGLANLELGQYEQALDCFERSLQIERRVGDTVAEAVTISNIALIYQALGQYSKSLHEYERSLEGQKKIGNIAGESHTLANIGMVYLATGQSTKALDYFERSLKIKQRIGDIQSQATILSNIGMSYSNMDRPDDAVKSFREAIEINEKIGAPTSIFKNNIVQIYLDLGNISGAEPLVKEAGSNSSKARLALLKHDYSLAVQFYEQTQEWAKKTGNVDELFAASTGLARAYEGMKNYAKASEYYEKATNMTEEIRSGLLTSERRNFFEVKIGGFQRSEAAKGLARVRMKLGDHEGSIAPSELTRARAFSDHLSQTYASGPSKIEKRTLEREQYLENKLATLKKSLAKTDKEKQSDKYNNISSEIKRASTELADFVKTLWKNNPAYAAVKYPKPLDLKDSALRPEECAVILDVSTEGVGVILIRNKAVSKAFYLNIKLTDLERDVMRFREPFEKLRLKDYDPKLAKSLYDKLLRPMLVDVPKGTPLTIIPDGILSMLPFEALVTGGEATWHKSSSGLDYPEGLTFLGDEHPISYYQSITALTLVRTIANREKPKDSLLVVADPVFNMKDQRAQKASETRLSQKEKEYNIQRMAAIEDSVGPLFSQLPETGKLATNLSAIYGSNCLSVTGLNADKLDFLAKIAPRMDQYGKVVFATHGVMGNKVPGVMEPFLALNMVPPGTDGFLKMSDILSLKMNSDIVALTACETGLGKDVSGEGVMSMGRAFQYAGARSVLMSLWSVADVSSVKLTESFFRHRKSGKSKLESLKLAREEIRKQGFEHPFFWAAFILVGEVN
jgi:tetratricopeptide (TPR) repeat protein